ncbi:MAG: hypothetical protein Q4B70_19415, partial [Lachnospiraceae bacterium]|nr:hypothetical protein [Lachnospiraceae bacterium]
MKKKPTRILTLMLCFMAGLMFLGFTAKADAAEYKQSGIYSKTKIGKYYIWTDSSDNTLRISKKKTGNGSVLATAASGHQMLIAMSDGSTVYYSEYKEEQEKVGDTTNYKYTSYFYRIKINKKGKTYLGSVSDAAMRLVGVYGNNLYTDTGKEYSGVYRFNLSTKKSKKIINNAVGAHCNGKYLITYV